MKAGKHVLCEKPMAQSEAECQQLYQTADENDVVLLEAIKTAYSPGFQRMVAVARSGSIGDIRSVDATFTKLTHGDLRELDIDQAGDRKSTRLNSSHVAISYAVFCLKKKRNK